MTRPGPVVLLLEAPVSTAAVRWAAAEAAARGSELHVLTPHRRPGLPSSGLRAAVELARTVAPRLAVLARPVQDELPRAARTASADAAVLVVGGPGPLATDLAANAFCPTVVVPDGPGDPAGPVLLAVGSGTEDQVVAFAFATARARRTRLRAVRAWSDPLVGLARPLPGHVTRHDAADAAERDELDGHLGLAAAHPAVTVETVVAEGDCAALLQALGREAALLVLGRPARGMLLETVAPSPVRALLREPPCPVAVVPPPGLPHRTLLPTRRVRFADLHR